MNVRKYRKLIIFLLDLFIIAGVTVTLFYMQSESNRQYQSLLPYIILIVICWAAVQYFFHINDSLWRYAQSKEYLMLLLGGFNAFLLFEIFDLLMLRSGIPLPFNMAVYSVSFLGMLFMRLCYRQYRNKRKNTNRKVQIRLAIIGAGKTGVRLEEELEQSKYSNYQTICFVDDNIEKIGKKIHNIEVLGPISDLKQILMKKTISEVIIAIPELSATKRKFILELASTYNCRVRSLPDTLALLESGEIQLSKNIRDIQLEELLGREQVSLNTDEIERFLENKVVMVTGGGGSIGSELCRQIAKAKVKKLIVIDIYENSLYDIQQELLQLYGKRLDLKIEIASIRSKEKVNQLFERHRPNFVFHAAAHKHVPLMEDCPEEAIQNNIFGTYHLVLAADKFRVDKFVLISTDKAVNPTSIMGASKRFCEMILQSMKESSKTEFVAVRFGNVLGSNGSVIPLFQKQIAQGGPVTITDKRMVRYFMTISEAVQLVLQAGAMANSSEVYVLDMGEPVKILDLAENLIRISGHTPYTEIPIVETGLRPGEKLYEELLINHEELIATSNHKIFIEHQASLTRKEIRKKLKLLNKALKKKTQEDIKKAMKQVVPAYQKPEGVNGIVHQER